MREPDCTCAAQNRPEQLEHSYNCAVSQWRREVARADDEDSGFTCRVTDITDRGELEDQRLRDNLPTGPLQHKLDVAHAARAAGLPLNDSEESILAAEVMGHADDDTPTTLVGLLTAAEAEAQKDGEVVEGELVERGGAGPESWLPPGHPDTWSELDWNLLEADLDEMPAVEGFAVEDEVFKRWDPTYTGTGPTPSWVEIRAGKMEGVLPVPEPVKCAGGCTFAVTKKHMRSCPLHEYYPCTWQCKAEDHQDVHLKACPLHPEYVAKGGKILSTKAAEYSTPNNPPPVCSCKKQKKAKQAHEKTCPTRCTCSAYKYNYHHLGACPFSTGTSGSYSSYSTCKHDRSGKKFKLAIASPGNPFPADVLEISLIAHRDEKFIDNENVDVGIYMYNSWSKLHSLVSAGLKVPWKDPRMTKAVMLDWTDMSDYEDMEFLAVVIRWALAEMAKGVRFETACMGGHGRTGTMAACMLMATDEGITPGMAIQRVQSGHCKKAIETEKQVAMVGAFYKVLWGHENWKADKAQLKLYNKAKGSKSYGSSYKAPAKAGAITSSYGTYVDGVWTPAKDSTNTDKPVGVTPVHVGFHGRG